MILAHSAGFLLLLFDDGPPGLLIMRVFDLFSPGSIGGDYDYVFLCYETM